MRQLSALLARTVGRHLLRTIAGLPASIMSGLGLIIPVIRRKLEPFRSCQPQPRVNVCFSPVYVRSSPNTGRYIRRLRQATPDPNRTFSTHSVAPKFDAITPDSIIGRGQIRWGRSGIIAMFTVYLFEVNFRRYTPVFSVSRLLRATPAPSRPERPDWSRRIQVEWRR